MRVALITARGGSKGLPRKNVLNVNGLPLIGWTINAARECSYIDRVFVSTEDEEIAKISLGMGAELIERPCELAQDNSTSDEVIRHAIDWLDKHSILSDLVVLLQPTSPLRTSAHISEAIDLYDSLNNPNATIISVYEPEHSPLKAFVQLENGTLKGSYNEDAPYTRRQELPKSYLANGAIYIFSPSAFMSESQIPRRDIYPYVMSTNESEDIDSKIDLIRVEKLLRGSFYE
ncbi:cytidylyltransferase domain-containing protein [Vibrio brasiliensis]|uniref:CMP-sialic acid synthetase n=1 Tax=Vibrio brasiliensis LMG 20546 TaxID=945543 RepID=E8M041_9VIBR|nr:acylneuraminate cytidylyltransferase family protein [Vibrio brasiliensis]EGA63693.1 CMP-sialic acid synthetase [Vibrio brasiliensis LMG 20546]